MTICVGRVGIFDSIQNTVTTVTDRHGAPQAARALLMERRKCFCVTFDKSNKTEINNNKERRDDYKKNDQRDGR